MCNAKVDGLKQERIEKKANCADRDSEVAEVNRRLTAVKKRLNAVEKQINNVDSAIQQKKSDRHALLQTCKVRQGGSFE